MDTGSRKWGRPYLNRRFFSLLGEAMADRCLLIMAKRGGRYIAGALNLIGGDCLYGRYWGAVEHHPCLHFEVCYYQAIDYAIAHGLRARRGRRPGRAQAGARLHAGDHLLGALDRRSAACAAPSRAILEDERAPSPRTSERARRVRPLSPQEATRSED